MSRPQGLGIYVFIFFGGVHLGWYLLGYWLGLGCSADIDSLSFVWDTSKVMLVMI